MKFVISNKKGQAKQVEVEDDNSVMGLKVGQKFDGSLIGFEGYEFEIRGGSDASGFPMRRDVQGMERKRILSNGGVGVKIKRKGMLKRKTVRGNTISNIISQINLYVVKDGKDSLFEEAKPEEKAPEKDSKEAPKEEAKAEKPKAEEKKETPAKEDKPVEKKE